MGALGSWDRNNDRVLARLCSRKYARLMKKLIFSDVIKSSWDIYIEFITGQKQLPQGRYRRNVLDLRSLIAGSRIQDGSIPPCLEPLPGTSTSEDHHSPSPRGIGHIAPTTDVLTANMLSALELDSEDVPTDVCTSAPPESGYVSGPTPRLKKRHRPAVKKKVRL